MAEQNTITTGQEDQLIRAFFKVLSGRHTRLESAYSAMTREEQVLCAWYYYQFPQHRREQALIQKTAGNFLYEARREAAHQAPKPLPPQLESLWANPVDQDGEAVLSLSSSELQQLLSGTNPFGNDADGLVKVKLFLAVVCATEGSQNGLIYVLNLPASSVKDVKDSESVDGLPDDEDLSADISRVLKVANEAVRRLLGSSKSPLGAAALITVLPAPSFDNSLVGSKEELIGMKFDASAKQQPVRHSWKQAYHLTPQAAKCSALFFALFFAAGIGVPWLHALRMGSMLAKWLITGASIAGETSVLVGHAAHIWHRRRPGRSGSCCGTGRKSSEATEASTAIPGARV